MWNRLLQGPQTLWAPQPLAFAARAPVGASCTPVLSEDGLGRQPRSKIAVLARPSVLELGDAHALHQLELPEGKEEAASRNDGGQSGHPLGQVPPIRRVRLLLRRSSGPAAPRRIILPEPHPPASKLPCAGI